MQLTWDLGMDHVRSWVLGGDYELDDSFNRPMEWSSTVVTGLSEAAAVPRPGDASAHPGMGADVTLSSDPSTSTPASSPPLLSPSHTMEQLRGSPDHVDDILIPKDSDVRRIFHNAHETWHEFVRIAKTFPRGVFPPGLDPSMMLKDMPALPNSIPEKGVLAGAPRWIVPDPDSTESQPNEDLDLNNVTGTTKYFRLAYPDPINCHITSDPSACHYGSPPPINVGASNAPQGLAILTMCWSYIFSTRLLQLQGRQAHYTECTLRPVPRNQVEVEALAEDVIPIQLPSEASMSLIHWLCAILAPEPGWKADAKGGQFSPWAATCTGDYKFVVITDQQVDLDAHSQPPSDVEATDLLIELCSLFGIGHDMAPFDGPVPLSPVKASFLATLAIPFYRMAKLQPQFPKPSLEHKSTAPMSSYQINSIHQYTTDLQYYMTLSMHQYSLGPVLWGMFWTPTIQCNLATPWLAAIKSVLQPYLEIKDFELIAKVFSLRRPRVAFWWHGLFLLGNHKVLEFISNYLDTLDEGCTYDTLARPDIVTTAWTGAAHSYQDDTSSHVYQDLGETVSRADLLRHRHTLTLRDPWPLFYGWRPFGSVPKESIEPDLYPWLERGHQREYQHWTWWAKDDIRYQPVVSRGFRRETGRFNPSVPDKIEIDVGPYPYAPLPSWISMPLEPSKRATLQMIAHSLGNIVGERSVSTAVMPGLTQHHPWLKDRTPA
ncbi:hypothetical protein BGZ63DRAFT_149213 [Mariannaea sp. PMI_226]|nr:hypothetical protein BGZ63DRAFT_149213 [Mariannaea sp. PMI_226]